MIVGIRGCPDCEASTSGNCGKHGTEEYLRVSYTGEVEAAKARLAETPHRCPVCEGRGTVRGDFYAFQPLGYLIQPITCRTCQGEGIIWRG